MWHRCAELYIRGQLRLPEIVKFWVIAETLGIVTDDVPRVGYGITDNTRLNNSLVLGVLLAFPSENTLSYPEIARILRVHPNTVANTVRRLVDSGKLEKQDKGRSGTFYKVIDISDVPVWIIEFTKALVELETDPELKAKVADEMKDVVFYRGWEVLKRELRGKGNKP